MISFNGTGSFLSDFRGPELRSVDSGDAPLSGDLPDSLFAKLMKKLADTLSKENDQLTAEPLLYEMPGSDASANTLSGQLLALADTLEKGKSEALTPQQRDWLLSLASTASAGAPSLLRALMRSLTLQPLSTWSGFVRTQGQLPGANVARPADTPAAADGASLQLLSALRDSLVSTRPSGAAASELPLLAVTRSAQPDASGQQLSSFAGTEFRIDAPGMAAGKTAVTEWAPIRVDTSHSQWARELVDSLGDRLSMQIRQQVKEASVRLDPPELGKLELIVRMDGDRLNIQLNASHAGVRDMLVQHADRLRNDLLAQNLQVVDVQVGQDGQGQSRQQAQMRMPDIVAARPEREESDDPSVPESTGENRWLSTSA